LTLKPPTLAVSQDQNGDLRVGGTRVLFELVINAYKDGARPEEIVRRFDVLKLADVYGAIGYYLDHEVEMEQYFRERDGQADALRRQIKSTQPSRDEVKARLLARNSRVTRDGSTE